MAAMVVVTLKSGVERLAFSRLRKVEYAVRLKSSVLCVVE